MGGGVGKDLEVDGRGAQFDNRFSNLIVIEWYRRCIILERESTVSFHPSSFHQGPCCSNPLPLLLLFSLSQSSNVKK